VPLSLLFAVEAPAVVGVFDAECLRILLLSNHLHLLLILSDLFPCLEDSFVFEKPIDFVN